MCWYLDLQAAWKPILDRIFAKKKIEEFLAWRRPIVVNRGLGDMDDLIAGSKVGAIVSDYPDNLRGEASHLITLPLNPATAFRCRDTAEKYFSLVFEAEKYVNLYSRMINYYSASCSISSSLTFMKSVSITVIDFIYYTLCGLSFQLVSVHCIQSKGLNR